MDILICMFLQHIFTMITYSHEYIDVYIFVQYVFTLYTREFIMFLQCAYQLQIGYIYSVYTITGTYVHTHMQSKYTSACNMSTRA